MGKSNRMEAGREAVVSAIEKVLCVTPPNRDKVADLFCQAVDDEEFCAVLAEVIQQNPGCARRACGTIDELKLRKPERDLVQRLVWNDRSVESGGIKAERELMRRRRNADWRPAVTR